jgi:antitoxin MazE
LDGVTEAAMKVLKWDDDLAVLLPDELVEKMGLSEGDELNIVEVFEGTVVVEKVDKGTKFRTGA